MRERPIIMSSESVQAILAGRKTQTRRVCTDVKKQPYMPGDRLWVKEKYATPVGFNANGNALVRYYADFEESSIVYWSNPMFMPKKYSRIALDVVNVRLERLQAISLDECVVEGYPSNLEFAHDRVVKDGSLRHCNYWYMQHWDALNAKRGFPRESNPWVWVIDFLRVGGSER